MRSLLTIACAVVMAVALGSLALAQGSPALGIVVEQPWAAATPTGAKTGAVYMKLDNKTGAADRLVGASSDVADTLQIHEMTVVDGVMQMRELSQGLALPAGKALELKPGSYHVMLIGLRKPLTPGQSFPLTLSFEKAGNIPVTVTVTSPGASHEGMHDGMHGGMGTMEMK